MSKQVDRSKSSQSRLGRGLGNLIPVPISRASPMAQPADAVATTGTVPVASPATGAPRMSGPAPSTPAPAASSTPSGQVPASAARVPQAVEVKPESAAGIGGTAGSHTVVFLPTRSIQPGKYQPRGAMDPAALEALAQSIATSGLMQPIVVRPLTGSATRFELIAGERRWRAMERLGRTEVPAIVQEVDDAKAAELSLVENLQREDLNPMDRAVALRRLADEFSWTHQELSQRIGLDRASVSNLLRLNDLDPACAGLVRSGAIALGHAKVLLGVADVAARRRFAESAASHDWSVRQLEATIRSEGVVPRGTTRRGRTGTPSNHLADLRRQLEEHLGTRVDLRVGRKKGAGELRIQFFSLDEFDGLMQRIGFKGDRMTV